MAKKPKAPSWRPSASERNWPSDPPVIESLPDDAAEQLTLAINLGDPFPPELCGDVLEAVNFYRLRIVHLDERPLGSEILGSLTKIHEASAALADGLKQADLLTKVLLLDGIYSSLPECEEREGPEAWDSLLSLIHNISASAQAATEHSLAAPVGHTRKGRALELFIKDLAGVYRQATGRKPAAPRLYDGGSGSSIQGPFFRFVKKAVFLLKKTFQTRH